MFTRIINILHFDRLDISEGIDVSKKSASKECDICHNFYFLNDSFLSLNQMSAIDVTIS